MDAELVSRETPLLPNYLPRIGMAAFLVLFFSAIFLLVLRQSKTPPELPVQQMSAVSHSSTPLATTASPAADKVVPTQAPITSQPVSAASVPPTSQPAAPITEPAPLLAVQTEVDPVTGSIMPCPQPNDPMAQLVCYDATLASFNLQFAQTSLVVQQEQGGYQAANISDLAAKFEDETKRKCGIDQAQQAGISFVNPSSQLSTIKTCVGASYEDEISTWKTWLQKPDAEEANRPIEDQVSLQRRLQELGFLPQTYIPSGLFDAQTVAAINTWKTSIGLDTDGLLNDADAQGLLGNVTPTETEQNSIANGTESVEYLWIPYFTYGACLSSNGNSIGSFVDSGTPPTDADARAAIDTCVPSEAALQSPPIAQVPATSQRKLRKHPVRNSIVKVTGGEPPPPASQPQTDPRKANVINSWLNNGN